MHVPLQLHAPRPLHGCVVMEPQVLHEQSAPHAPGLHAHVPHVHVPRPLHVAPTTAVGHGAVEHSHVPPDHPDGQAHWPVAQAHEPLCAHELPHPWHVTHSGEPLTTEP